MFKFYQLVVEIFIMELQIVFQTSKVNSNIRGNMEEFERNI